MMQKSIWHRCQSGNLGSPSIWRLSIRANLAMIPIWCNLALVTIWPIWRHNQSGNLSIDAIWLALTISTANIRPAGRKTKASKKRAGKKIRIVGSARLEAPDWKRQVGPDWKQRETAIRFGKSAKINLSDWPSTTQDEEAEEEEESG